MDKSCSVDTLIVSFMKALSLGIHQLMCCNCAALPRFACRYGNGRGELSQFERLLFFGMAIGAPAAAILIQRCERE